ncbi:unnamed protein product [Moneuplotes crassus]|uniref:Uncharacterized protein n=1 Tax=Euplotes crassus TaxID=5936 RepID=A0AAD1UP51_EUPCR|nr:unnamed protein product [Moneuplotes crassus]
MEAQFENPQMIHPTNVDAEQPDFTPVVPSNPYIAGPAIVPSQAPTPDPSSQYPGQPFQIGQPVDSPAPAQSRQPLYQTQPPPRRRRAKKECCDCKMNSDDQECLRCLCCCLCLPIYVCILCFKK